VLTRRGRWKTLCARGAWVALLGGRSTPPLGVVTKRVVAAFLLAPLVGALLYSSPGLVTSGYPRGFSEFLATTLVAYMFAALATLAIALPAYLLLNRFKLVRWWSALSAGSVVGLLFALMGPTSPSPLLSRNFQMVLIGAASGLVFWFVCSPVTPSNKRWR